MSRKTMLLYSLLVMFAFYSVYITYAILVNPQRYSVGENMVMGGLFSVGLGFSIFCLFKGNQQMRQGLYQAGKQEDGKAQLPRPFYEKYSKRIKRFYRIAQITAAVAAIYLTLYSIDPHAVKRAPLHILILVGLVFLFFALTVIFQQKETKKMKRMMTAKEQQLTSLEQEQMVTRFMAEKYLKAMGWMAVFLVVGYMLLVYFGSEVIPATPLYILGLLSFMVICFVFALFIKQGKK